MLKPSTVEQELALATLLASAASVSKSILEFEKWLVAGYAAIFVTAIPKYSELGAAIGLTSLWVALAMLAVALVVSVPVLVIGAQLNAAAGVLEELRKLAPPLLEGAGRPLDLAAFQAEQMRGLWWPASAAAGWSARRQAEGDWVAPGRMLAKLSQAQGYLAMLQIGLGIAALVVCLSGLVRTLEAHAASSTSCCST